MTYWFGFASGVVCCAALLAAYVVWAMIGIAQVISENEREH